MELSVRDMMIQDHFYHRAAGYFVPLLRDSRSVEPGLFLELIAAWDNHVISDSEWNAVVGLTALARGKSRMTGEDTLIAMQVASTVDLNIATLAIERTEILRRLGLAVKAAVGGWTISPDADDLCAANGVIVKLTDWDAR